MKIIKTRDSGLGMYFNLKDEESGRVIARNILPDHAEFITTACNAHDQLVAALHQFSGPDGDYYGNVTPAQIRVIKAALKAAGAV